MYHSGYVPGNMKFVGGDAEKNLKNMASRKLL